MADPVTADIDDRLRAALDLLRRSTREPWTIDSDYLNTVQAAGLDALAIEDAANVDFHYNVLNRLADAFDFDLPTDEQRARVARVLQFIGASRGLNRRHPSFLVRPDGVVRPVEVEETLRAVLDRPGATDSGLRRQVFDFVRATMHARRNHPPDALSTPMVENALPADLALYLDKLAKGAYRIVDADVEVLRAAGRGEDELFELTLTGALSAAVVGTEAVFGALHGPAATMSSDGAARAA